MFFNLWIQDEKVSEEHNLAQFCHGHRELKLLLGRQEDSNIYMKRQNLVSSIVISSPAIYCFLMMMLRRSLILICQIKPLIWRHVFIPLAYLVPLVIMLQSKFSLDVTLCSEEMKNHKSTFSFHLIGQEEKNMLIYHNEATGKRKTKCLKGWWGWCSHKSVWSHYPPK